VQEGEVGARIKRRYRDRIDLKMEGLGTRWMDATDRGRAVDPFATYLPIFIPGVGRTHSTSASGTLQEGTALHCTRHGT
jgi:hypothetical protein